MILSYIRLGYNTSSSSELYWIIDFSFSIQYVFVFFIKIFTLIIFLFKFENSHQSICVFFGKGNLQFVQQEMRCYYLLNL